MDHTDIEYICTAIADLSGVPVRIYQDGERVFYHSLVSLPKDPVSAYEDLIGGISENIGYCATDRYCYYGIVNSGKLRIVMGPTSQTAASDKDLYELAFRADVDQDDISGFVAGMKAVSCMPLESLLQILCTLNFLLNGEKKTIRDVAIYDEEQESLSKLGSIEQANARFDDISGDAKGTHNTYDLEQLLMNMVRKGETAALREWFSNAPPVRGGVIAPDQLRQLKNTFIVTATLASRAAIRGGMAQDDAFPLSDSYIQKCETLSSPDRIMNLQYHMILEFTGRVERLHLGDKPTKLTVDVANYVQHHISEPVSVESLARELYMSRPYLSRKFREESGETLTDFILKEKTEEAKRLLRYTEKPLSSVSSYLGFSSQSHFNRVFRKYTGMNPGEYRERRS